MTKPTTNRFVSELIGFCNANVLVEKWLIAPSFHVGRQWLDALAQTGNTALNVRVKTFRTTAIELAGPTLAVKSLSVMDAVETEIMIGSLFEQMSNDNPRYLSDIPMSNSLSSALTTCISDIRMAGLTPDDLNEDLFEVSSKGQEIAELLERYLHMLQENSLVDYADVLSIAYEYVPAETDELRILAPSNISEELRGLERKLWEQIPASIRRALAIDTPGGAPDTNTAATDLAALRWIQEPTAAPNPPGDKSAQIFAAVGASNEVKEVLRRIVKAGAKLDQVEIVHTDPETYDPLFYETTARIHPGDINNLPITFAQGIPVRYSRPARLLLAWVSWVQGGFLQNALVTIIQEGLVKLSLEGDRPVSLTKAGRILREVPIGMGKEHYLPQIDKQIEKYTSKITRGNNGDKKYTPGQLEHFEISIIYLRSIKTLVAKMLSRFEQGETPAGLILKEAAHLVQTLSKTNGHLDTVAKDTLTREVLKLGEVFSRYESYSVDPWDSLLDLVQSTRVNRQAPAPGCIHVAGLKQGGHSGRKYTYVLGLDDSRFPGTNLQDALLLDKERKKLSDELMTSELSLKQKMDSLSFLLSRLQGDCTLSFCSRSLEDDRLLFPSPAVTAAYRILNEDHTGDQESLFEWLDAPASFAPDKIEQAMDLGEWWTTKMCIGSRVSNGKAAIAKHFPHLGQGELAIQKRSSEEFTEYDGFVPEAGKDHNPYALNAKPLSASGLESFAKCPLDFFFEKILEVSPPDEHGADPSVWLSAADKGSLLHDVFRVFMEKLTENQELPMLAKHHGMIKAVLSDHLEAARQECPPPSEEVFAREAEDMEQVVTIFLRTEEKHCQDNIPAYFEVSLGLPPEGKPTKLDSAEPIKIRVAGRKTVRVRGRIDRIDETKESSGEALALWDYKTGSSYKYKTAVDTFDQGRIVQNVLYSEMMKQRLKELKSKQKVASFGYVFPNTRELGFQIKWNSSELKEGCRTIEYLCDLLASGSFPDTNDKDDLSYSDYRDMRPNIESQCEDTWTKMENPTNETLEPFVYLRTAVKEEDNE